MRRLGRSLQVGGFLGWLAAALGLVWTAAEGAPASSVLEVGAVMGLAALMLGWQVEGTGRRRERKQDERRAAEEVALIAALTDEDRDWLRAHGWQEWATLAGYEAELQRWRGEGQRVDAPTGPLADTASEPTPQPAKTLPPAPRVGPDPLWLRAKADHLERLARAQGRDADSRAWLLGAAQQLREEAGA